MKSSVLFILLILSFNISAQNPQVSLPDPDNGLKILNDMKKEQTRRMRATNDPSEKESLRLQVLQTEEKISKLKTTKPVTPATTITESSKAEADDELAPIVPVKDSGFQLKKIKLETCKWDTKQPKRIIQAPGCSIAGTKICIGYVECESSSPDSPNMTRMSTCSEENCNNASECTKEGGYGSTEYRESIDSPKKLPKKSAVKKE